jgi:hypothetical protein
MARHRSGGVVAEAGHWRGGRGVAGGESDDERGAGARASAAKKLLRERPGSGVACRSNSSNRWCASYGLGVPARTRSVAAAKAEWGDQECEGSDVEVGEELRCGLVAEAEAGSWRGGGGGVAEAEGGGGGTVADWRRRQVPRRAGAEGRRREWLGRD